MQQDVEESEAKINAQLRQVALAMKQTLKQAHARAVSHARNHMQSLYGSTERSTGLVSVGHSLRCCVDNMERETDQCIVCSVCQAVVPQLTRVRMWHYRQSAHALHGGKNQSNISKAVS